ncbi:MAG: hypothetical protein U9P42_02115 [Candidatus Fermentibacteria bacterium]|nr:hypothetical protein [Candidatus Fermentibacteria bacterium]
MTSDKIESDIGYLKDLVSKSDNPTSPASIYILWALILMAGFSIIDFAPGWVGLFWMIAGPAGGMLSGFLGYKAGANKGQMDREVGIKHALHWGGMMVIVFLAILLGLKGLVHGVVNSQVILLVVALGWWTAGVHFDRIFLWLGGIMVLGFLGTLFINSYAWTAMGVLLGTVLIVAAIRQGKKNVQ